MPKKTPAERTRRSKPAGVVEPLTAGQEIIGADETIEVQGDSWLQLDAEGAPITDGAGKPQLAEPFASMETFDLLPALPARLWESDLVLYLYRLNPEVSNKTGEKKYIGVYSAPMNEEDVKREHGGGKYRMYLKYKKHDLRTAVFQIDGPPKFLEGQTVRGVPVGSSTPAPAPAAAPDLASVVDKLVDTLKSNQQDPAGALNSAVQILTTATERGLELQHKLSAQAASSTTGSPMMDKLLEAAMAKLLNPTPAPSLVEQIATVKELAAVLRPPKEARSENPEAGVTSQMAMVKEFFGVDSLSEVMEKVNGAGRKDNTPWWGSFLMNTIEKLTTAAPTIIAQYAQLQRENFERALTANNIRSGRARAPLAVLPGNQPEPVNPAATAAAAQPANAVEAAMAAIEPMVRMMCQYFDRGFDGAQAAAGLIVQFPEMTEQFKPVLTDLMQLNQFISEVPQLAERAKDPEWESFRDEFWREMNVTNDADEEEHATEGDVHVDSASQTAAAATAP